MVHFRLFRRAADGVVQDPRACLLITFFFGSALWSMPCAVVLFYGGVLWLFWRAFSLQQKVPPKTGQKIVMLSFFWAGIKFITDGVSLLYSGYAKGHLAFDVLEPVTGIGGIVSLLCKNFVLFAPLESASLLFLRLLLLLFTAQALTSLYSPRTLGLAVCWFLRPFLKDRAWRPALALTMMLQFLPYIYADLAQIKTAARLRGVRTSGVRFWQLCVPRLLDLLFLRTYAQAIAVASRRLDSADSWECPWKWSPSSLIAVVGVVGTFLLSIYLFI